MTYEPKLILMVAPKLLILIVTLTSASTEASSTNHLKCIRQYLRYLSDNRLIRRA